MLRKTHISIGIATALAIIHPTTVADCLFALMGGAIGGWLPDIDLNTKKAITSNDSDDDYTDYVKDGVYYDPEKYGDYGNDHPRFFHNNDRTQSAIQIIIIIALSLLIDRCFNYGICHYFVEHFEVKTIIGLFSLILLVFIGTHTRHRTFTHSILGSALFCFSVWLIAKPLGISFSCGFLAHLIVDILNKKPGNQYFWPYKKRIYMNLVPSDGICNALLGNIGVIISIILFFFFLIPCLINDPKAADILSWLKKPVITIGNASFNGLTVYLVIVNTIALIAFTIESLIYRYSFTWQYSDEDSTMILSMLDILAFAGGGLCMLISVLFSTKGRISKSNNSNNTTLYIVPIISIIIWTILSFVIINPFNIIFKAVIYHSILGNIVILHAILIYYFIINLITFLLIMFHSPKSSKFTAEEILTIILSLCGGAIGCYLAMSISNRKMAVHHFSFGIPLIIIIHAILFSLIAWYASII